ncbi:hypothetical protein F5X99DRAFT_327530 [Biscogniauxia marginata]|nr:hypothetical protein F5X99DRAFT_327530 [Biscogniauxia marginata]
MSLSTPRLMVLCYSTSITLAGLVTLDMDRIETILKALYSHYTKVLPVTNISETSLMINKASRYRRARRPS